MDKLEFVKGNPIWNHVNSQTRCVFSYMRSDNTIRHRESSPCHSDLHALRGAKRLCVIIPPHHQYVRENEEGSDAFMHYLCTDFPLAHACLDNEWQESGVYEMDVTADTWEVHHWCVTARLFTEHSSHGKAWWALVQEGMDPAQAFLTAQCYMWCDGCLQYSGSYIGHYAISESIGRSVCRNFLLSNYKKKGRMWTETGSYNRHGSMFGGDNDNLNYTDSVPNFLQDKGLPKGNVFERLSSSYQKNTAENTRIVAEAATEWFKKLMEDAA